MKNEQKNTPKVNSHKIIIYVIIMYQALYNKINKMEAVEVGWQIWFKRGFRV